jgi:hypothetical protein
MMEKGIAPQAAAETAATNLDYAATGPPVLDIPKLISKDVETGFPGGN